MGHGNCTVLVDTDGVVVIDAGPKSKLLKFLKDKNITKIDVLLLSHADQDHIIGVSDLLASGEIEIKKVYVNTDSTKKSEQWDDLAYTLWDAHKRDALDFEPLLTPNLNGKLDQGQVVIEVLAPNQYIVAKGSGSKDRKGRKLTTNSISAVIRLFYHGKPVALLPGDIDEIGLDNLLEETEDIQAWLAVFPHHGGKPGHKNIKAFTTRFCEAVKPDIVIFSIRENLKHFPTPVVVKTAAETLENVCLFSTRSSGALKAFIEKTGSQLHQDGVGTMFVDLTKEPLDVDFISDGINE